MNANNLLECEDVGVALREGRPLRPARAYGILYAQDNLNFHAVKLPNPVPLGREILEIAGAKPVEEFSLFAILRRHPGRRGANKWLHRTRGLPSPK